MGESFKAKGSEIRVGRVEKVVEVSVLRTMFLWSRLEQFVALEV